MHQAGALHLADVAGTFAGAEYVSPEPEPEAARAPLGESALEHWRRMTEAREGRPLGIEPFAAVLYEALYGD